MEGHNRNGNMPYDLPTIANPPPTIFGAYNHDGTPIPPVLSGPIFGDHGDVGSADDNDPKRRRIARVGENPPTAINSMAMLIR